MSIMKFSITYNLRRSSMYVYVVGQFDTLFQTQRESTLVSKRFLRLIHFVLKSGKRRENKGGASLQTINHHRGSFKTLKHNICTNTNALFFTKNV